MLTLTTPEYWSNSYKNVELDNTHLDSNLKHWILANVPGLPGDCCEIGCFPGGYLSLFGDAGYELNGIDFCERVNELASFYKKRGYRVGSFHCEDFLKIDSTRRYDTVVSFGFLEHFVNWEQVLLKHINLVKPGGHLMIAVPNFSGRIQKTIHRTFDKDSYSRHHIEMMDPALWTKALINAGIDFKVVFAGHIGEFSFWTEPAERSLFARLCLRLIKFTTPLLRMIYPINHPSTAPYCGIVLRKSSGLS